jgi:molybdopterin-guanine dinucleotide biosynthesis protein A
MGTAKLALPFGPETMLERIVRLLGEVCQPLVVVAAPEQDLPSLAAQLIVARDRRPERGPLEGLAAGLRALPDDVEAAYVTSCDVPLLAPAFVARMFELLGDHSAAVPESGGYLHPLAAVYRRDVIAVVEALLAADRMRPAFLFDTVATRRVTTDELIDFDPRLDTLKNLNRPSDYLDALAQAGFTAPAEVLARFAAE